MPSYWTKKDERQYQHIQQSEIDSGKKRKRAIEIAARTVNKNRASEGRTASKHSSGTGNPDSSPGSRSRAELYNRAQELKISGRSSMNKAELAAAIERQPGG